MRVTLSSMAGSASVTDTQGVGAGRESKRVDRRLQDEKPVARSTPQRLTSVEPETERRRRLILIYKRTGKTEADDEGARPGARLSIAA